MPPSGEVVGRSVEDRLGKVAGDDAVVIPVAAVEDRMPAEIDLLGAAERMVVIAVGFQIGELLCGGERRYGAVRAAQFYAHGCG